MYILSILLSFCLHCKRSHEPNEETAKVLRETDEGKNLIEHKTLEEFWDALGFSQHAN